MINRSNYRIEYLIFALGGLLYLLMHAVAAHKTSTVLWGVDCWRYLPPVMPYILIVAGSACFIPFVQDFLKPYIQSLGRFATCIPFPVWLVLSGILLFLLRQKTFFLGDGQLRIRSVEANYLIFAYEEPLDTLLHTGIHSIVRRFIGSHGKEVFQWMSIAAGIAALWGLRSYLGKLYKNNGYRWFLGCILVTTGSVQLFFGYAESYTLVNCLVLIFLLSGLLMIKQGKDSAVPAVFLSIAVITHPVAVLLLPGIVYAYLFGIQKDKTGISALKLLLKPAGIFALCVSSIMLIFWAGGSPPLKFLGSYLHESNLLPLTGQGDMYGIFSLNHGFDMLNEIGLILPAWFLIVFIVPRMRTVKASRTLIFLLVCCAGPLFFLSAFNPKLGYARDWDIFAITAFPATLLLGTVIIESSMKRIFRIAFPLVIISVLHTVPWIWVNSSEPLSRARFELLSDTPHWTNFAKGTARESLATYYRDNGENERYLTHYETAFDLTGNKRYFSNIANMYSNLGDAERLRAFTKKDSLNAAGYFYLGTIYLERNILDRALIEYERAYALDADYPGLHLQFGQVYIKTGRFDESIREFKLALDKETVYEEKSVHAVRNNLGYIYVMKGMLDEAVKEYEKAMKYKPDFPEAYLNLSKVYYKLKKDGLAKKYAQLALAHGSSKEEVDKVLGLISARK